MRHSLRKPFQDRINAKLSICTRTGEPASQANLNLRMSVMPSVDIPQINYHLQSGSQIIDARCSNDHLGEAWPVAASGIKELVRGLEDEFVEGIFHTLARSFGMYAGEMNATCSYIRTGRGRQVDQGSLPE